MAHIRIISPSGAIDSQYIEGATKRLLSWGHTVSEGRFARGRCGRFAGTDDERLMDINEALADSSVDYILCARGGYGLQRILPRIVPVTKPIIGFSDITALHQISRVPSLHGIMCKHIATLPEDALPLTMLRDALDGKPLQYNFPVTGPVVGGNLSVLYGLQGTPYALSAKGKTLLLEDIAERHYHVERMLLGLKISGALEGLKALLVGQFTDCDDDPSMGETLYETIGRLTAEYNYPVIYDVPIGHVDMNLPIWLNQN